MNGEADIIRRYAKPEISWGSEASFLKSPISKNKLKD